MDANPKRQKIEQTVVSCCNNRQKLQPRWGVNCHCVAVVALILCKIESTVLNSLPISACLPAPRVQPWSVIIATNRSFSAIHSLNDQVGNCSCKAGTIPLHFHFCFYYLHTCSTFNCFNCCNSQWIFCVCVCAKQATVYLRWWSQQQ